MDAYDAIPRRRSIRKFEREPLSTEMLDALEQDMAEWPRMYEDVRMGIHLLRDGEAVYQAMRSIMGISFRVRAPHYLMATAQPDDHYMENVGFTLEYGVLALCAQGVGSCWLGTPVDERRMLELADVREGQRFVILVAIGYAAEEEPLYRETPPKRKPVEEWVKRMEDEEETDISAELHITDARWQPILTAMGMAPSAMNGQPWRVVLDGQFAHVYAKNGALRKMTGLAPLDVGIALCHADLAARAAGMPLRWEQVLMPARRDMEYITSLHCCPTVEVV